jgi:argininosuccinate lyase
LVDDFHSSLPFDKRLYRQDIAGSIAHATMLGEQGIISMEDAQSITAGLRDVLADMESGKVAFSAEAEDIHMQVETLLIARIGEAGKRLHTGRSRNDQVALDVRMYAKDENLSGRPLCARRILHQRVRLHRVYEIRL